MKKFSLLLCGILLFQLLCACNTKQEEFEKPVSFYYENRVISYNSSAGVVGFETREGQNLCESTMAIVSEYLQGPKSEELQNLLPQDTQLISCLSVGELVNAELRFDTTNLSDINLITVSAAMLMTLHDCMGAQSLYLSVVDPHQENRTDIIISMDDIALMDMLTINE